MAGQVVDEVAIAHFDVRLHTRGYVRVEAADGRLVYGWITRFGSADGPPPYGCVRIDVMHLDRSVTSVRCLVTGSIGLVDEPPGPG